MPPLQRAFTFAQVNDVAVLVANDLNFDMPRLFDVFFDKHASIAERTAGLAGGALKAVAALFVVLRQPHSLAAASRAGLEHHGIADLIGNGHGVIGVDDDVQMPGNRVHAGCVPPDCFEAILSPMLVIACGGGPMNSMPAFGQSLRRIRPFPRGIRIRDAPLLRRYPCRPGRSYRSTDSFAPKAVGRCRRPRRPMIHAERPCPPPNTRPRSRMPILLRRLDYPAGDLAAISDAESF